MFGSRSAEGFGQVVSDREQRWQSYLVGIVAGKPECLALLYDESSSSLLGLALKMLKNKADAEEVLLDAFEQVWRTAHSFNPLRGSCWRWLTILVRSRAIDRMRTAAARRDRVGVPLPEDWDLASQDPLPESASISNQERFFVRNALQLLPGEQRQAVELAYFLGLTHVEIAAQLGVPLGTIKTRIRAATDKLRISLSRDGGFAATGGPTQ